MELIKNSISHDQRKKIFAMMKELNISKEKLYEYMPDWCGAVSLSSDNCNSYQADKIIECLNKVKNKTLNINTSGKLTEAQFNAIKRIQESMDWTDNRIRGFIKHTIKIDCEPKDLTPAFATKVITGLNVYKKQLAKKSA